MRPRLIEGGPGRIHVVENRLHVVSGIAVPKFFNDKELDTVVGLVHTGLQENRGFMGPATRRQIREDLVGGNAVVVASEIDGTPVFDAIALAKPAKADRKKQEIRTVLNLNGGRTRTREAVQAAVIDATWLAAGREPEHGMQALVATSNGRANRLFSEDLGAVNVGERDSDYVHVDGDRRKPRVRMNVYNMVPVLELAKAA